MPQVGWAGPHPLESLDLDLFTATTENAIDLGTTCKVDHSTLGLSGSPVPSDRNLIH